MRSTLLRASSVLALFSVEVIGSSDRTALCLQQSIPSQRHGTFDVVVAGRNQSSRTRCDIEIANERAVPIQTNLTCDELKRYYFRLCDTPPQKECLLAKVPWRIALSVASCCFSCCLEHWQRKLGMEEVYSTMKNVSSASIRSDPSRIQPESRLMKGLPKLSTVLLQEGSMRRFSVARFLDGQKEPWILPNRAALSRGGIVVVSDGMGLTEYPNSALIELLERYPVGVVNQGDIPWPQATRLLEFRKQAGFSLFELPKGGKTIAMNGHTDLLLSNDNYLLGFLGVKSLLFEALLGDTSMNENRRDLFMCCCMGDHRKRAIRASGMRAFGLCGTFLTGRGSMHQYTKRLASARMVWSPAGYGLSNYRDVEAVIAGAVPVMDGLPGRRELFEKKFRNWPAVWVPGKPCKSQHFCPEINVTRQWLEAEWEKIMARRCELDIAEAFWPYWLYQLSVQI